MVAFKNSTGIKANSSFCTFRFPTAEARQLVKPFQYQPITTTLPTQPIAHFVFMPIRGLEISKNEYKIKNLCIVKNVASKYLMILNTANIAVF